jgi:hypothetical protein
MGASHRGSRRGSSMEKALHLPPLSQVGGQSAHANAAGSFDESSTWPSLSPAHVSPTWSMNNLVAQAVRSNSLRCAQREKWAIEANNRRNGRAESESRRAPVKLMRVMLYMASIHFPGREPPAARHAAKRLTEELHQHGDKLRELDENHPVMLTHPCYDREWGNAEVGLAGFLDMIVAPSFRVFVELFPRLAFMEKHFVKYRKLVMRDSRQEPGQASAPQAVASTMRPVTVEVTHTEYTTVTL